MDPGVFELLHSSMGAFIFGLTLYEPAGVMIEGSMKHKHGWRPRPWQGENQKAPKMGTYLITFFPPRWKEYPICWFGSPLIKYNKLVIKVLCPTYFLPCPVYLIHHCICPWAMFAHMREFKQYVGCIRAQMCGQVWRGRKSDQVHNCFSRSIQ